MNAHPYLGIACSLALRLGLHSSLESLHINNEQRQKRIGIYITILKLDVYSSIVLGLPQFIAPQSVHKVLKCLENDQLSGQAFCWGANHDATSMIAISLKHLELLNLTAAGLKTVFLSSMNPTEAHNHDGAFSVNVKDLEAAGTEFKGWANSFSSLLQNVEYGQKIEM